MPKPSSISFTHHALSLFKMATEANGNSSSEKSNGANSSSNHHVTLPAKRGHKLERYINLVPSVAFNAVLQASWSAVAVSFQAGLLNGDPTSLVWGMLASCIGSTAVAASLAEMASINPVVGGAVRISVTREIDVGAGSK